MKADAEIGELEHCLTTDLLNHLVFVQKVFMKEVNEVVQKMSGSDRPVPVWTEFGEVQVVSSEKPKPLLFSVAVRLKNFTITATTPANSGVRFETGVSELQISNRVETVKNQSTNQFRISTKARVNMKLSLGQIIRDTVYFEEFQTQAYFKTTIQMSNVIQNLSTASGDKDVIHINLTRPLVFVQPIGKLIAFSSLFFDRTANRKKSKQESCSRDLFLFCEWRITTQFARRKTTHVRTRAASFILIIIIFYMYLINYSRGPCNSLLVKLQKCLGILD